MTSEKKIGTLIVLLVVVLALMGYIYMGQSDSLDKKEIITLEKPTQQYVELNKEVEVSGSKTILNERFRVSKATDGKVIVTSKDGSIYQVREGVILIDNNIVKVSQDDASIIVLENRN